MIRHLLNWILVHRADQLVRWMSPYLPRGGAVIDIGAGTGHTVQALQQQSPGLNVVEVDVVNIRVIPGNAVLFDGYQLPFADGQFSAAIMIFVLQYCNEPQILLRNLHHVMNGPVMVIQSTYHGRLGHWWLQTFDFLWGPIAFQVARICGLVHTSKHALDGKTFYTLPELIQLFQRAGFQVQLLETKPLFPMPMSYHIFRLEKICI
ncbi:MAG: methyltransferase domain-containing protein [Chloroflexota bacterium]